MSEAGRLEKAALSARGIERSFGAQIALAGVDLDLRAGEIVALLGSNGAGKSTLVKILTGSDRPDAGELRLGGSPALFTSMLDAARKGVATVTQELTLFPDLTIGENIAVFQKAIGFTKAMVVERLAEVFPALALKRQLETRVGDMSLGEQQKLEIARAILNKPGVLVLDEPTSSLHSDERNRLQEIIADLRKTGVAILYVTHYLQEALNVSDRIVVLRDGKAVATMNNRAELTVADLVGHMTGRIAAQTAPLRDKKSSTMSQCLRIRRIELAEDIALSNFVAHRGEIVGFAGLDDSGVVPLMQSVFGIGRILSRDGTAPSGQPLPISAADAVRSGFAYVPSDRKSTGLMLDQGLCENMMQVRSLTLRADGLRTRKNDERARALAQCKRLGVQTATVDASVRGLSGGNQQKVLLGKWLEVEPEVLILDDPTRGVDIAAKSDIHDLVRKAARAGAVVLLHSTDPKELIALSDRILVFAQGYAIAEGPAISFDESSLMARMNGRRPSAERRVDRRL